MTKDEQLLIKALLAVLQKKADTMSEALEGINLDEYDYYEGLSDAYGIASNLVSGILTPYLDDDSLNDEDTPVVSTE